MNSGRRPTASAMGRLIARLPRPLLRHRVIRTLVALAPGSRFTDITFNGSACIRGDLRDDATRQALITGFFEPEFFAIAAPWVDQPRAHIFDVGSNAGLSAFGLLPLLRPDAVLHLFEANGHLCRLSETTARDLHPERGIHVNHACVTDRDGTSSLRIVEGAWGSSHIREGSDGTETVRNLILDEYIATRRIPAVPFLKMDIEGFEPRALSGLARSLAAGQVDVLYVEVSGPNLSRYGCSVASLLDQTRDLGLVAAWCKQADFDRGLANGRPFVIGGRELRLDRVEGFPPDHQTDLLFFPTSGRHRDLAEALSKD